MQRSSLAQHEGCVDEREVSEGLWEVAELPLRPGIPFLCVQTEFGPQVEQPLEQLSSAIELSYRRKRLCEPERAGQKTPS